MNIVIIGFAECPHYIRALNRLNRFYDVFAQEVGSSEEIDQVCLHFRDNHRHLRGWRSSTSPQIIVYNQSYDWCIGGEDNLISIGCNSLAARFENEIERLEADVEEEVGGEDTGSPLEEVAYYKMFYIAPPGEKNEWLPANI